VGGNLEGEEMWGRHATQAARQGGSSSKLSSKQGREAELIGEERNRPVRSAEVSLEGNSKRIAKSRKGACEKHRGPRAKGLEERFNLGRKEKDQKRPGGEA